MYSRTAPRELTTSHATPLLTSSKADSPGSQRRRASRARTKRARAALLAAAGAVGVAGGLGARADVTAGRSVALLGGLAPDTGGLAYGAFGLDLGNNPGISINSAGRVSFAARLSGPGVTANVNDFAFFAGTSSADTRLVLRRGDAAAGAGAGVVYGIPNAVPSAGFSEPILNVAGVVAVRADVRGTGVSGANEEGIWAGTSASGLTLLTRRGNATPDAAATFVDLDGLTRVSTNDFYFQATLSSRTFNSTNDTGVFHVTPAGAVTTVIRTGQVVGDAQVATLDSGGLGFTANGAGAYAGRGTTTVGAGMTDLNGDGRLATLFYASPLFNASNQIVDFNRIAIAREGGNAPGTGGALLASFPSAPSVNDTGQTVFTAMLASSPGGGQIVTGGADANNVAVYRAIGPSLSLIARANDVIQGMADAEIASFTNPSGVANDGSVLLQITPRSIGTGAVMSNAEALYLAGTQGGGGFFSGTKVVQEGVAIGTVFTNTGSRSTLPATATHFSIDDRAVNSVGQVVYRTDLTQGNGIDSNNNTGIYLYDARLNQTELLVREGDQIDVNPDPTVTDLRTVLGGQIYSNFGFFKGGTDGDPAGFNDWAEVPVYLKLSGGVEGVFVLTPTPEWRSNADGFWSNGAGSASANPWTTRAPNAVGAVAKFGRGITQARRITLDGPKTVGKLAFDHSQSYTLASNPGSPLTLDAGDGVARIVVDAFNGAGTHHVLSPIVLKNPLEISTAAGTTLNLTGNFDNTLGKVITKSGPGTVNFDGVQLNGAGVGYRVTGGAMRISNDPNVVLSTLGVGGAGTLQFANPTPTISTARLEALAGGGTLDLGGRNLTVGGGGGYDWQGALTVSGGGTVSLSRDAATGGPVAVAPGASLTTSGVLSVNSSGDPFTSTSDPTLSAAVVNNGTMSLGGGAKRVAGLTGTGTLTVNGGTALTVAGPLVQASVTTGGPLSVAGSSVVGSTTLGAGVNTTFEVGAGATYEATNSFAVGAGTTLNKTGGGKLRIANGATIDAGVTLNVNGGSLAYNAPQVVPAGTVTNVNSGGTLGGRGTFAGHVAVRDGGNLNPGDGIGTLTVNTLKLDGNNAVSVELGTPPASGRLHVSGVNGLTVSGPVTIVPLYNDGIGVGTYTVIDYEGNLNGSFSNFSVGASPIAGLEAVLVQGSSSVDLVVNAVGVNQWKLAGGGSFNANSSFTANTVPNGNGTIANFLSNLKTSSVVSVNAPVTVGRMNFDNAAAGYTLGQADGTAATVTLSDPTAAQINVVSGSHAVNAPLSLSSNLTIDAAGDLALGGALSTPTVRTITKTGAAALTLSGTQTHAAGSGLVLNGGTVNFNADPTGNLNLTAAAGTTANVGASGAFRDVSLSGASLALNNGNALSIRTLTSNGGTTSTLNVASAAGAVTVTGQTLVVTNSILNKTGPGLLSVHAQQHGTNSTLNVNGGSVRFNAAGGTNLAVNVAGGAKVELNNTALAPTSFRLNGGTLEGTGASSLSAPLAVGSSGSAVSTPQAGDVLTLNGMTMTGQTVAKNGAGTVVLSGTQSYTSGSRVDVNQGTFRYDGGTATNLIFWVNSPANNPVLHVSNVTMAAHQINFNGGTLLATGANAATGTNTRVGTKIDQGAADGIIDTPAAGDTFTINGSLDFNFYGSETPVTNTLRKTGPGTVVVNGTHLYNGARTTTYRIQQGTWRFNTSGGSSTRMDLDLSAGANLAFGSGAASVVNFTMDDFYANGGTVAATGTTSITANEFNHDASTTLSTANGTDTLNLTTVDGIVGMKFAANTTLTKTGLGTVNTENLRFNFGANSKLQVNGGTFRFKNPVIGASTGNTNKNLSIALAANSTLAINNNLDPSAISIAGGTLLGEAASAAVAAGVTVTGATTLSTPAAGDGLALNGPVTNNASLTKAGAGTLRIAGAQTHTGLPSLILTNGTTHLDSDAGGTSGSRVLAVNVVGSAATVNFNSTQRLASLTAATGRANVTASGSRVLDVTALDVSGGGVLDLTNNGMIVRSGTLADVTSDIARAYNGGAWNGTGITTSLGASNSAYALAAILNSDNGSTPLVTSFMGQAVNAGSILVKYTLRGDTDLDGDLDADDYFRVDRGFLTRGTGWRRGDVNYDNVVNLADYALIDAAYTLTHPAAAAAMVEEHAALFGATYQQAYREALASVPEPSVAAVVSIAALATLGRRRRRQEAVVP